MDSWKVVATFESVDKILWCDLWEHLNMLSIFCFSITLGTGRFFSFVCVGQSYKQPNGRYKDLIETGNFMKTPPALRVFFHCVTEWTLIFFWNCGFVHFRDRSLPLVTKCFTSTLLFSSFWIACSSSVNSITFHYKINEWIIAVREDSV